MSSVVGKNTVDALCEQTWNDVGHMEIEARERGAKLAVEVIADSSGKFCGNALRFDTALSAVEYGIDLSCRWFGVRKFRVVIAEVCPECGKASRNSALCLNCLGK